MGVLDEFSLNGKVAVVTGSSRGLGQAMAIALAEAGADVIGVATRHQPKTKDFIESLGRRFLEVVQDVTRFNELERIIDRAIETFGHVDILVNNAGIIRRAPALQFSEKDWNDVIDVNLKSAFTLSQAFARRITEQQTRGKIINIASVLSFQGGIFTTAYTVSKHGILGLTRVMANELAKFKINVNAIAPGYMVTDISKPLREDPKRNAEILSRIPMGRWGMPSDLKGVVVFLASEASDYMTGAVIPVDGGWLVR